MKFSLFAPFATAAACLLAAWTVVDAKPIGLTRSTATKATAFAAASATSTEDQAVATFEVSPTVAWDEPTTTEAAADSQQTEDAFTSADTASTYTATTWQPISTPLTPATGSGADPEPLAANPYASITYTNQVEVYPGAEGANPQDVIQQCYGLEGAFGIADLHCGPLNPEGISDWAAELFPEWDCQGTPIATAGYHGSSTLPLKDAEGNVFLAKSVRFIPAASLPGQQ